MSFWTNTMLMGSADPPPVIASFSQSGNSGGSGVQLASVTNMADGLFEPFAATPSATDAYVRATLAASAYVTAIILGPTTGTGSWGAQYLNGCILEISANNGANWTTIRTLASYVTATNSTTGTMRTESIGAVCTDIRIRRASGYVGVSEFKLSP